MRRLDPRRAVAQELQHLGREQPHRADRQPVGAVIVFLDPGGSTGNRRGRRRTSRRPERHGRRGRRDERAGSWREFRQGRRRGLSGAGRYLSSTRSSATMMAGHARRVAVGEMASAKFSVDAALRSCWRPDEPALSDRAYYRRLHKLAGTQGSTDIHQWRSAVLSLDGERLAFVALGRQKRALDGHSTSEVLVSIRSTALSAGARRGCLRKRSLSASWLKHAARSAHLCAST